MNGFIPILLRIYSRVLLLYPHRFHDEFAEEMLVVFRDAVNDATQGGILPLTILCLKELGGSPMCVLREFWHEFERKETIMATNEKVELKPGSDGGTGYWDAMMGTLPFALFGIASMIGKSSLPFHGGYADLAFYTIALAGLLIGLVKGFPRWAYSYLGWSLLFAWWWTNVHTPGLRILGHTFGYDESWGWSIWIPLLATSGVSLLWTRLLHPFRQLVRGVWQDWTLASLLIYTFIAFMALIYDENHHPYLFLFMTTSTIVISASVWYFLRNKDTRKRAVSLLTGFVLSFALMFTCDATWDWHAYYGYPRPSEGDKYMTFLRIGAFTVVYGLILFLPALLGFLRRAVNNRRTV